MSPQILAANLLIHVGWKDENQIEVQLFIYFVPAAGVGTRARDRQTRMTSPDVIGVGIRGQPQITDEESGSHLM